MKFFDPPPVRYMGSKWKMADWIISQFPPHKLYVEPFCGSAAVFFRKENSVVDVLNDLNGELVNFFRVLRSEPDKLINLIELTPFSLEEYHLAWKPARGKVERARRFYVRSWQAFASDTTIKSGWRRVTSSSRDISSAHDWTRLNGLHQAVEILRGIQIESKPAIDCMLRYDSPETLFYVDPPYVHSTRKAVRHKYNHELSDRQHEELAAVLTSLKGYVVLSGYDSKLYEQLYAGWETKRKQSTTNGHGAATETLWLSPNVTQKLAEIEEAKRQIETPPMVKLWERLNENTDTIRPEEARYPLVESA